MALLLVEGFDDGLVAQKGWAGSAYSYVSSGGRFGGGAVSAEWANSTCSHSFEAVVSGSVVVGCAIMLNSASKFPGGSGSFQVLQCGPLQFHVMETAQLGLWRGDTNARVALSTNGVWRSGVWQYFEMKHDLGTGLCTVLIDGSVVLTATVSTSEPAISLLLGVSRTNDSNIYIGNGAMYFDDIYVLDSSGTANNDFLGDVQVRTLLPTADGSELGMTPSSGTAHYSLVNEPTPDTTTYVSSAAAGTKDTYQFAALPASTGTVFGVQATNYATKDAAGTAGIANVTRINGTDYVGANTAALSASWAANSQLWEQNPATSVAWTASQVNSAEFGVETS